MAKLYTNYVAKHPNTKPPIHQIHKKLSLYIKLSYTNVKKIAVWVFGDQKRRKNCWRENSIKSDQMIDFAHENMANFA